MSEIRFTPGPWDIDPKNTDEVYAGNGMIAVAECDGQSWDQIEANAHLIAAAPDLYRAAEYFEWCADGNGDGTANHCAVCEAHQMNGHSPQCWLGNVLAKARGEP